MGEGGRFLWNDKALRAKLRKAKPQLRHEFLLTLILEELIHRCHDLVDPFAYQKSGVRWSRLKNDPIKQLVLGAYQGTTHYRNLGEEYLRMLVQVRNGFPLTEEFYRDTKALREALMRPQSAEVEAAVKRVSEMLFHGRASEEQRRPVSGERGDARSAEQLPEADAGGTAGPAASRNRDWGEIALGDQGATVEVRRPGETATRTGVAARITGKAVVIQPENGKPFGAKPEEVRVIDAPVRESTNKLERGVRMVTATEGVERPDAGAIDSASGGGPDRTPPNPPPAPSGSPATGGTRDSEPLLAQTGGPGKPPTPPPPRATGGGDDESSDDPRQPSSRPREKQSLQVDPPLPIDYEQRNATERAILSATVRAQVEGASGVPQSDASPEDLELAERIRKLGGLLPGDRGIDWHDQRRQTAAALRRFASSPEEVERTQRLTELLQNAREIAGREEHKLFVLDSDPERIYKITKNDNFGGRSYFARTDPDGNDQHFIGETNADPFYYLNRWRILNAIGGFKTRYEGMLPPEKPGQLPRICISQPLLPGENPNPAAMKSAFENHGYVRVADGAYFDRGTHILLTDVKPDNVRVVGGVPVPFDAMAQVAIGAKLQWCLEKSAGRRSSTPGHKP